MQAERAAIIQQASLACQRLQIIILEMAASRENDAQWIEDCYQKASRVVSDAEDVRGALAKMRYGEQA